MHDDDVRTGPRPPWWMAPHALVPLILVPLLTAAWLMPVGFHWNLGRYAKFMTGELYLLALTGTLLFALGSFAATRAPGSAGTAGGGLAELAASPSACRLLRAVGWVLFAVTVAAYAIWFMPVARDPSILFDVLAGRGAERAIRDTLSTIPGVTTLVQAQIVYVTLFVIRWCYVPAARPNLLEMAALATILGLAFMRNLIWSERLAVIEVMVTFAILLLRRPRFPVLTALAPVFGFLFLFAFFSLFEYFRSWSAFYKTQYDSFLVFILARFSGYYVTALDNGAGMFAHGGGLMAPLNTADWFWKFPVEVGQTWLSKEMGLNLLDYEAWLYWNATPEFNNASGIFMPFIDFGAAGGLIFLALFGVLTGLLFRSFARGGLVGMLIYPSWFVGVLELPRIYYVFSSRYFPVLMIAAILLFALRTLLVQERRLGAGPLVPRTRG